MRSVNAGCLVAAIVLAAAQVVSSQAVAADELMTVAKQTFKLISAVAAAVGQNAATPEKIELGKLLFFDPRMSPSEIVSCNTCHNVGTGGSDAGPTAVGHGWQKGARRTPSVFNAVFNTAQFWDGRAVDLKTQAKASGLDITSTPDHVIQAVASMPAYVELFKKAFPHDASPVTFENVAVAVEAFESTLITPGAPFDKYLESDDGALNA